MIGRCIDETTRREGSFDDGGKQKSYVSYVTGYRCDGATFEHTVYADAASDPAKPITERGEPIELVPFGARVLFSRSTYAKDKETGQKLVQRITGRVLDVQKL